MPRMLAMASSMLKGRMVFTAPSDAPCVWMRPGVTLMLLWVEYREREPDGYAYSRFCELYAAWRLKLAPTIAVVSPGAARNVTRSSTAPPRP